MSKIKSAVEILTKCRREYSEDTYIIKAMKEYTAQYINLIADNVIVVEEKHVREIINKLK